MWYLRFAFFRASSNSKRGVCSMSKPQNEASLLEKLHTGAQNLPVRQRQVCDYLLNNYQQVAFMTIKEVAKTSGLSPSTIVRTAASLGFNSYNSLRQSIKSLLFLRKHLSGGRWKCPGMRNKRQMKRNPIPGASFRRETTER